MRIKLIRAARYNYKGETFEKGYEYDLTDARAQVLLNCVDDFDRPYFKRCKTTEPEIEQEIIEEEELDKPEEEEEEKEEEEEEEPEEEEEEVKVAPKKAPAKTAKPVKTLRGPVPEPKKASGGGGKKIRRQYIGKGIKKSKLKRKGDTSSLDEEDSRRVSVDDDDEDGITV